MAIDYEALGKRISNARKQIGITQEALGEVILTFAGQQKIRKKNSASEVIGRCASGFGA